MELTFLSWNINNRGNGGKIKLAIRALYKKYKPDFFLLIESDLTDEDAIALFDSQLQLVAKPQALTIGNRGTIRLYANRKHIVDEIADHEKPDASKQFRQRMVVYKFKLPHLDLLIFGLHFPSKYFHSDETQYSIMREWKTYIEQQESYSKTTSSIILGDFNLNPFDYSLNESDAIHSNPLISSTSLSGPAFYNPMWSVMGDFIYKSNKRKVPGTYYFARGEHDRGSHYWNAIDGVLVKAKLENAFIRKELEIITHVNRHIFSDSKQIFEKDYSDHLPIKFKLNLNGQF